MAETVYEGTWEEILRRAPDVANRRLRVTVLAEEPTRTEASPSSALERLLDEADRLTPERAAAHANPQEAEISESVAQKFRRQGFDV